MNLSQAIAEALQSRGVKIAAPVKPKEGDRIGYPGHAKSLKQFHVNADANSSIDKQVRCDALADCIAHDYREVQFFQLDCPKGRSARNYEHGGVLARIMTDRSRGAGVEIERIDVLFKPL